MQRVSCVVVMVVGVCLSFASEGRAACFAKERTARPVVAAPRLEAAARRTGAGAPGSSIESSASIVGLWNATFLLGDGPGVYDQGFQQWHVDNTELMVDNAVSPSFGNVCIGVWKQVGPRTYKLKHMTFNWNADGTPAGTFLLEMTVTTDRRGNVYSGTYVADSFDLAGKVIPELHVAGNVRGVRITVD
jgi:hypothetical protein